MKMRNTGKSYIVSTAKLSDGEGDAVMFEQKAIKPGEIGEFDENNPSVKIYSKAGLLTPVESQSKGKKG